MSQANVGTSRGQLALDPRRDNCFEARVAPTHSPFVDTAPHRPRCQLRAPAAQQQANFLKRRRHDRITHTTGERTERLRAATASPSRGWPTTSRTDLAAVASRQCRRATGWYRCASVMKPARGWPCPQAGPSELGQRTAISDCPRDGHTPSIALEQLRRSVLEITWPWQGTEEFPGLPAARGRVSSPCGKAQVP